MFDAELCNDCVNRADLHAVASACVAEHRSLDICVAAWVQEGEHLQAFNEARLIFAAIATGMSNWQPGAGVKPCREAAPPKTAHPRPAAVRRSLLASRLSPR